MNKADKLKREDKIKRAREIKLAKIPTQINIAAIDQATLCGISYEKAGTNKAVVDLWDLNLKGKQSQGMKWILFESRLKKFLLENEILLVAYELPAGQHKNAIIHASKLICIIEKICCEIEIDYIEFSAKSIKKFATGNGNAGKPLMVEYAKKLWGYEGEDDNESDSLHILNYLKSKIN